MKSSKGTNELSACESNLEASRVHVKYSLKPGVVVHICKASSQETAAEDGHKFEACLSY